MNLNDLCWTVVRPALAHNRENVEPGSTPGNSTNFRVGVGNRRHPIRRSNHPLVEWGLCWSSVQWRIAGGRSSDLHSEFNFSGGVESRHTNGWSCLVPIGRAVYPNDCPETAWRRLRYAGSNEMRSHHGLVRASRRSARPTELNLGVLARCAGSGASKSCDTGAASMTAWEDRATPVNLNRGGLLSRLRWSNRTQRHGASGAGRSALESAPSGGTRTVQFGGIPPLRVLKMGRSVGVITLKPVSA